VRVVLCATCTVCELARPRVGLSATWLSVSWPVRELSSNRSAQGVRIEAPKVMNGVRHWEWCPPPQPTKRGLRERRELPVGSGGGAPAANAFLAYLKPKEQPIKAQFFVKDHSVDRAGPGAHIGFYGPFSLRHASAWLQVRLTIA